MNKLNIKQKTPKERLLELSLKVEAGELDVDSISFVVSHSDNGNKVIQVDLELRESK